WSTFSATNRDSPVPSEPTTTHRGSVARGNPGKDWVPLPSRPMVNMPAFLYSVRALLRLLTFPTGTRAAAPAEVFQTVEVTPTERRDGMTTASALKAEAERKMAPKLRSEEHTSELQSR